MPKRNDIQSILVVGAGPIIIGQACEFDYSGTQACRALRQEGYRVILINSNPATIMTDKNIADATYLEPITVEAVEQIIQKEQPDNKNEVSSSGDNSKKIISRLPKQKNEIKNNKKDLKINFEHQVVLILPLKEKLKFLPFLLIYRLLYPNFLNWYSHQRLFSTYFQNKRWQNSILYLLKHET